MSCPPILTQSARDDMARICHPHRSSLQNHTQGQVLDVLLAVQFCLLGQVLVAVLRQAEGFLATGRGHSRRFCVSRFSYCRHVGVADSTDAPGAAAVSSATKKLFPRGVNQEQS